MKLCRSNRSNAFFGRTLRCAPFLQKEGCGTELNYFKDILFDLINESDELDVTDIQSDDSANSFVVTVKDGTPFLLRVSQPG